MKLGKAISHSITIKPSANQGFFVWVGCAGVFVFADKESLLSDLKEYLDDPMTWEGEYSELVGVEPEAPTQSSSLGQRRND